MTTVYSIGALLLSAYILLGQNEGVAGYFCTQLSIDQCLTPFQRYSKQVQAVFPKGDTMDQVCSAFKELQTCVEPMKSTCTVAARKAFEGVLAAFEYVCSENGLEIYRKHDSCLGSFGIQTRANKCLSSYGEGVQDANYLSSRKAMYKEMCEKAEDYLDCIYEAVEDKCGEEAADWQHTVNLKALTPQLDDIDCQIDGKCGMRLSTILGIVAALALIFLVVVVVTHTHMKNKRRCRAAAMGQQGIVVCSATHGRMGQAVVVPAMGPGCAAVYTSGQPPVTPATAPAYEPYYAPPAYTDKEAEKMAYDNPVCEKY